MFDGPNPLLVDMGPVVFALAHLANLRSQPFAFANWPIWPINDLEILRIRQFCVVVILGVMWLRTSSIPRPIKIYIVDLIDCLALPEVYAAR